MALLWKSFFLVKFMSKTDLFVIYLKVPISASIYYILPILYMYYKAHRIW